jgi:hypothetical protein
MCGAPVTFNAQPNSPTAVNAGRKQWAMHCKIMINELQIKKNRLHYILCIQS